MTSITVIKPNMPTAKAIPCATFEANDCGFAISLNKEIITSIRSKNAFSFTSTSIKHFGAGFKPYFPGFGGLAHFDGFDFAEGVKRFFYFLSTTTS